MSELRIHEVRLLATAARPAGRLLATDATPTRVATVLQNSRSAADLTPRRTIALLEDS